MRVSAGTGSIALGRHPCGKTARGGGWALSIMGDEGSGEWVSRHALRHLARWFDGTVPDSLTLQRLRRSLSITEPKQLSDLSTEITDKIERQPQLGKLIDLAAEQGDAWATDLLEKAAEETMALVTDLMQVLELENEIGLPVGIWGSNIVDSRIHRNAFTRMLQEKYPHTKLCLPQKSATEGAVQLALERLQQTP